jgi:hypothetical protein
MSSRFSSEHANSATIEAGNAHTLKAAKMQYRLLVAMPLCLAVGLRAEQPAANFQSQEFRSALAEVLHARFDDFAELKTSVAIFQLPQMSCSLAPQRKIASYICSAPASPGPSHCRESLGIDASANLQEQFDQPQCIEIDLLASHQPVPEENFEPAEADAAADSVHDASIQAEIDEAAGTNNYSPLPPLTESRRAAEQDKNRSQWVVENGTQYTLHVLMSGPSDQRIDVAPGNSKLIALPPGKYKVAAVLDRSGTLLFYGEQMLQSGLNYTSHFVD